MDAERIMDLVAEVCPMNVDLCRLRRDRPACLPVAIGGRRGKVDTTLPRILRNLTTAWEADAVRADGWRIGSLKYRIGIDETWFDVRVLAVLQRTKGLSVPRPDRLAFLLHREIALVRFESPIRIRGIHAGETGPLENADTQDWELIPVTAFFRPEGMPRWQYPVLDSEPRIPSLALAVGPARVSVEDGYICSRDSSGVVGRWGHWPNGLQEENEADVPRPGCGYLEVSQTRFSRFLSAGFSYGWVCEVEMHSRDRFHGKYKVSRFHQMFGMSAIVRPVTPLDANSGAI
jgi:hypothetical protein